ncbi:MAG: hypothetical protein CME69_12370 [Halobacteriovorax sp.]|nr:hypothetical protein [Halobacteriovorax sp.]|tara:strand:- start:3177 stop:4466 length:1290 start_codon:yes stop_codon:yes gene_type:complete
MSTKIKELLISKLKYDKSIQIKVKRDRIIILNSLRKLEEFYSQKEVLEDIISRQIFHFSRVKKSNRLDEIHLHTKNFAVNKNYIFKNILKDHSYFGNTYNNDELLLDFNSASSILTLGESGSGKTQSNKIIIQYYIAMCKKFYADHKIVKIIVDPKSDDYKDLIANGDFFTRLKTNEDLIYLIRMLDKVINESEKFNQSGDLNKTRYILCFDEILEYLSKTKELDKERESLKYELAKKLQVIATQHCRIQKILFLLSSQSFSVSECVLSLNKIVIKLFSKPQNTSIASVFGTPEMNQDDLQKGRFIISKGKDKVQFPFSLSNSPDMTKLDLIFESMRNYFNYRKGKLIVFYERFKLEYEFTHRQNLKKHRKEFIDAYMKENLYFMLDDNDVKLLDGTRKPINKSEEEFIKTYPLVVLKKGLREFAKEYY